MTNKLPILQTVLIFFFITSNQLMASTIQSIYELKGEKIIFLNNNNIIIAEGKSEATDQFGRKIFSEKIIYNKNNKIITTESKSTYIDQNGNKLLADNFVYNLNLKIIEAIDNVLFTDKNDNKFYFNRLKFYDDEKKGYGINFKGELIDKSNIESVYAEFDQKKELLTVGSKNKESNYLENFLNIFNKKSTYTPCENKQKLKLSIKEQCPDWSLDTQKTIHDKKNKMVYHYGSVVKIKNIPVFYTPYFSHPDPSVKRKSGFLLPSIKNFTDLGQTFKTPYFWNIDDNQDLTITPIYYFDENSIFLAEYRLQNKNGKLVVDSSYSQGYKNLNKRDEDGNLISRTGGSRNHFFINFLGSYDNLLFDKNDIEFNIQRVSQKNYLNVNEINTTYIKQDIASLKNNFILNSYRGNERIFLETSIFEDLSNDNDNTKYQYTVPSLSYSNFYDKFNQRINLNSFFSAKNLGGDSNQIYLTNQLNTESELKIFNKIPYVGNMFKTSIKNVNTQNQNIIGSKENFNSDTKFTLALENSLPFIRFDFKEKTEETLTPKILTKFTSGSMDNASSQNKILTFEDIYSLDRMGSITNPETGASIGYGIEYNINKKNSNNDIFLNNSFSIGQVIKKNKNSDMPSSSSLNETESDFVGNVTIHYNPDFKNEKIKSNKQGLVAKYNYILSNDFGKILKNELVTNYENEKNLFSSIYYETHDISNDHYIEMKYFRNLDNDFSLGFGGRRNIQNDFTENNFIELNYDTDCIKIALLLSKKFYQNADLQPSNNLTLSIMLKPFGSPVSPDLSSFVN